MRRKSPLALAALLAATAAVATSARSAASGDTASGAAGAQAGERERTLYVSVVDTKGEPVEGMGPSEFVVREDGVRREVLRVSRAVEPIDIAILVDNSAATDDEIVNIREGLTKFVELMRDEHQIAIVGLAGRPTIFADYTTTLTQLNAAIGRLFPESGSGMMLLDAIVETSRGLSKRESDRAVILAVLTDGPEFSNLHFQTVLDTLKTARAGLHAVTIGRFTLSMADELRNRETVLDRGPRETGGQRVTLLSSMATRQALEKIARELKAQYKVVYGRPQSLIPPQSMDVSVTRPGLTARGTPARRQPGA
jgi:VWFA-related protein